MSSKIKSSLSSEEKERVITNTLIDLVVAMKYPETPANRQEQEKLSDKYKSTALAVFNYIAATRYPNDSNSDEINRAYRNIENAMDGLKESMADKLISEPRMFFTRWKREIKNEDCLVETALYMLGMASRIKWLSPDTTSKRGHPKKDRELDVLKRALEKGVSETDVLRAIKQDPPAESDGYAFRGMARHYLLQTIKTKHPDDDVAETLRNRWKSARNRRKLAGKHGTKIEK